MPSKGSTPTSIRLTAEDVRILDAASEILGADSRVDAVVLMARTVVEASRAKTPKQATARAKQKAPSKKAPSTKAPSKAPSTKAPSKAPSKKAPSTKVAKTTAKKRKKATARS